MEKKTPTCVKMDQALRAALVAIAKEECLSGTLSAVIRKLLKEGVRRRGKWIK